MSRFLRTGLGLGLGFTLVSCSSFNDGEHKPQAQQLPTQVTAIDFYGTDLKFVWQFTNPFDKEIRLLSYVWELEIQGKQILRGQSRQVRKLAPHSDITIELPANLRRSELEKLLATNSLPYEMPYSFLGKANLGASVRSWGFDLKDEGKLQLLVGPQFEIQKFHIRSMDESRANVALEILIRNPNTFATKLENFHADIILAGQTVAQGVSGPASAIEPNATAVVPLELDLNFTRLGRVVRRALLQDESSYTIYGKTDLTTPWGVKKLNYDQSGKVNIQR